MNYQILNTVGIILLSLCGFMLIISALLFFRFKIIGIIGDLTGKTAKRQIEKIRDENIKSGNKRFKPSFINLGRGKLTEEISMNKKRNRRFGKLSRTGKDYDILSQTDNPLAQNKVVPLTAEMKSKDIPTEVLQQEQFVSVSTDILSDETDILGQATDILDAGIETEVLSDGTEVLTTNEAEVLRTGTDVLSRTGELNHQDQTFSILKSIMLIHTVEVI